MQVCLKKTAPTIACRDSLFLTKTNLNLFLGQWGFYTFTATIQFLSFLPVKEILNLKITYDRRHAIT